MKNMKNTKNNLDYNFKTLQNTFLTLTTLIFITLLLLSPFVSTTWGQQQPEVYNIIYKMDMGGKNPDTNPKTYVTSDTPISILDAHGPSYTFLGWAVIYWGTAIQEHEPELSYSIPAGTTGDITLTAIFDTSPLSYSITYNLDGGTNHPSNRPNYFGDNEYFPISISAPYKQDYDFLGWTVQFSDSTPDVTVKTIDFSIKDGTTGHITLTAHWQQTVFPDTYTVKYNGNGHAGGSVPIDSKEYLYDSEVIVLGQGSLTRNNHVFIGWALNPTATTPNYIKDLTFKIQSDTILYAVWYLPDTPPLTDDLFIITYKPGTHGTFTEQNTDNLPYGVATPTAPVVTGENGWKFTGWSPIPTATVMNNAIYVAQWEQEPTATPSSTVTATPSSTATSTPAPSSIVPTQRDDEQVNLIKPDPKSWSLVNLLLSIMGVLVVVVITGWLLISNKDKQKTWKTNDGGFLQRWTAWLVAAVILSIVNILIFLITENLSLPSGWITNNWTILNIAILAVEAIAIWLCIKTTKANK
jgi:uncharacterized repeat protein (TIGR02543 family)